MIRQARTGDIVLVKSREMTGGTVVVSEGRRGKDDRKQNTLTRITVMLKSANYL
jgi:hypothetical protein